MAKLNMDFKKTKYNGYCQAVEFTKWYEPITLYPLQVFAGLMMCVPYFGAKLFTYVFMFSKSTIEKKEVVRK